MLGKMNVNHIRCYGYHGVYPEERKLGQWYIINLELYYDIARASVSDQIEDTTSYIDVYEFTKEIVENSQYQLLEALTFNLVQKLAEKFNYEKITASVKKEKIPVNADLRNVEFTLNYPFE